MSDGVHTAFLGLGSNLGDRQDNLNKAIDFLSQRLKVIKVSSVYDTEPVDNVDQPRFLNLVCQVSTTLKPEMLLTVAKAIESKMGRLPKSHNKPRPIDIDILFYDDLVMETPDLTVPHPRVTERGFVLIPLSEIAPDLVHPVTKKSVREIFKELGPVQGVLKL